GGAMPNEGAAEYRSRVRKPLDFDAFWSDVLGQAAEIPLDAEVVPDSLRTSDDVEVFQVFYTSIEHVRVAGWYCRPARRAARTPAVASTSAPGAASISCWGGPRWIRSVSASPEAARVAG